jgi:hypothetical protein
MIATSQMALTLTQSERESVRKWLLLGLGAYGFGVLTGIGYFSVGGIFALLSDAASVMMGLTMIPVVMGLAKLFNERKPGLSQITRLVGLAGFSLLTLGGLILVFFYFMRTLPGGFGLGMQFFGIFLQGVWLILVGSLALQTGVFSRKIAFAGITAGAGYFVIGISSGLSFSPLSMIASAVGVAGYVLWALWTRTALKSKTS